MALAMLEVNDACAAAAGKFSGKRASLVAAAHPKTPRKKIMVVHANTLSEDPLKLFVRLLIVG